MSRSLPGGRTTQSPAGAAAVAAAREYAAAAPGTSITLPAHVTPARAAILSGTAPPPPAATGPTVIKPSGPTVPVGVRGPTVPAPVFDDMDAGADDAPGNPYLGLLAPAAGTLTDTTDTTGDHDPDPDPRWLLPALGAAALLLAWGLWKRFR